MRAMLLGRLQHLFTTTVGVPLRRYVLWLKLQRAVGIMATGGPLAGAAVEAGFADQAHLSRTFRRMLGFTPTAAMSRLVQDGPGEVAVASPA